MRIVGKKCESVTRSAEDTGRATTRVLLCTHTHAQTQTAEEFDVVESIEW